MNTNRKRYPFISGRFPYPLHKGDQLVLFNNIKLMSEFYNITLLTMYDNEEPLKNLDKINHPCEIDYNN